MPEGDSLHRAARKLTPVLTGQVVRGLSLPRRTTTTAGIVGSAVTAVEARGKNLLVHFAPGVSLHVHLKMNGRIRVHAPGSAAGVGKLVARIDTEGRSVSFLDAPVARLIRRRDLVRDLHFRHLGPDLLGDTFDVDEALRRLRLRRSEPLGVALMDQAAVAGIGNVWKSELCFNRRLDPFAPLGRCDDGGLRELLEEARVRMLQNVHGKKRTLHDPFAPPAWKRTVRDSPRMHEGALSVYGRRGEPCFDCGAPIAMRYQGAQRRSTYYCPRCQGVTRVDGSDAAAPPV